MHRSGSKFSPQDNNNNNRKQQQQLQQQQKQKKRLSFRDPEVEGPQQQQSQIYGGCRPKALIPSTKYKKDSPESISLEEQALQIAQSVGSAFSGLDLQRDLFHSTHLNEDLKDSFVETNIDDFPTENSSYQDSNQSNRFKFSSEDQEYLERDLIMRCPTIEPHDPNSDRNSIPAVEEKFPSSAHHQIQLLKYQLDQQTQQTQMAFYQVQLLTDQMEAECAARHKVQEQNNQLMVQNQELLSHIEKLFQQIEELERQIRVMEQERKPRMPQQQEPQTSSPRPSLYMGTRRLSNDPTSDSKLSTTRVQSSTRSSFTSTKPLLTTPTKLAPTSMQPNTLAATRRSSLTSPKPFSAAQTRNESTLHIGDTSPPVQASTLSPFGSAWRLKSPEPSREKSPSSMVPERTRTSSFSSFSKLKSPEPSTEKSPSSTIPERTRTSSFSSFSKLKPPEINTKSSLFGGSNSGASSGVSNSKKHSSSTSDLYNTTSYHSSKPSLTIEDTSSSSGKSAISNVNTTPISKLPRYQAYTGYQRRSSLTKDFEQNPSGAKDKLRNY